MCAHAVCADAVLLQVRQIERRWALQEAAKYEGSRLLRTADAYESAVGFIDASRTDDWRVMHLNAPAVELLGKPFSPCGFCHKLSSSSFWLLQPHCWVSGAVAVWVDGMSLVSVLADGCSALCFNAGVDWRATYDDLAKLSDGRHFSGFEGLPLNKLLDINMSQAVSGQYCHTSCPALLLPAWVSVCVCLPSVHKDLLVPTDTPACGRVVCDGRCAEVCAGPAWLYCLNVQAWQQAQVELSLKNVKGVVGTPCEGKAFNITLRCAFMSDACMGQVLVSSQVGTAVHGLLSLAVWSCLWFPDVAALHALQ